MAPRIQFRVTEDEYSIITQNAAKAGYPSVSQFLKELALAYPKTLDNSNTLHLSFRELYDEVTNSVKKATKAFLSKSPLDLSGISDKGEFVLREVVPRWKSIPQHKNTPSGTVPRTVRASLGKQFFKDVVNNNIPNVKYAKKTDKYGTAVYQIIPMPDDAKEG